MQQIFACVHHSVRLAVLSVVVVAVVVVVVVLDTRSRSLDVFMSTSDNGFIVQDPSMAKNSSPWNSSPWRAVVVVEWLNYSDRLKTVRWADLSDFFVDFRRKNVCFCFTSNENCHFSSEKR